MLYSPHVKLGQKCTIDRDIYFYLSIQFTCEFIAERAKFLLLPTEQATNKPTSRQVGYKKKRAKTSESSMKKSIISAPRSNQLERRFNRQNETNERVVRSLLHPRGQTANALLSFVVCILGDGKQRAQVEMRKARIRRRVRMTWE